MTAHTVDDIRHAIDDAHYALDQCRTFLHGQAISTGALYRSGPQQTPLGLLVEGAIKKLSQLIVSLDTPGDPGGSVDVDALAQLVIGAQGHVHDGDFPGWDDLRASGREEARVVARWLLARLVVTARTVDAEETAR